VKSITIARNYAEALLLAAEAEAARGGAGGREQVELYGELIDAVAGAIQAEERIAVALDSPRVSKATKERLLANALRETAPATFVRFLQAIVRRGRQGLIGEIAQEYHALVDLKLNRVHAGVTLAMATNGGLPEQITERLSRALGKDVRAHFRIDPAILGGVVVRVGDRIFDGSLRRKLNALRRKMLTGE
jgi:F-type H+-transporting ATPase subunit delta